MLSCPSCAYSGHGFSYIERVPNISPVVLADGFLVVRLNQAELRYDEIADGDQLECPACQHQFAVPASVSVQFVPRSAGQLAVA